MNLDSPPILLIQDDWNSTLNDVGAEAWISCKSKDNPGIHGKIRTIKCFPDEPLVTVSEGFHVENISSTSITVKHRLSPYETVFVAPHRTFNHIHNTSVTSIDVNTESLAVSFSVKGDLLVWDTRTEEIKVSLKGHLFEVYRCGFFPSGKVVLSCGSDMTLRIWCVLTGQCPVTLKGHTRAVTDFGFINKGRNVLSTSKDGKVKLWNCADASCIADIVTASSSINCCKVVEAPAYLNLQENQQPASEKEVDTQNKIVLYGCEDGTMECVAIASRRSLFSLSFESAVNCIAVLGDQFVCGFQNGQICLYSFKNLEDHKTWHESNSSVLSLLPFRNKGFFASRADGSAIFIPLNESYKRASLTGPNSDPVYQISSDGKHIFTCCRDGSVRLYIVENVMNTIF